MKKFINKIKKINFKSKRALLVIALLLVLVVGVTIAFYNSNASYANKFKTSAYDVQIKEEFYGTWGTKKVEFYNNDTTPVVIRVTYNEMWKSSETEDNKVLYLSNKIKVGESYVDIVTKDWTESWNNDFVLGNDGWYYYKKVLNEKDKENSSVTVLNSIGLSDEIKDSKMYSEYLQATYELDFNFEAIEATEDAVEDIWGHKITISDGSVNWPFA